MKKYNILIVNKIFQFTSKYYWLLKVSRRISFIRLFSGGRHKSQVSEIPTCEVKPKLCQFSATVFDICPYNRLWAVCYAPGHHHLPYYNTLPSKWFKILHY